MTGFVCEECHFLCKNCVDTYTNCIECHLTDTNRVDGSTCPCAEGYYDVGILVCSKCAIFCKTCEK